MISRSLRIPLFSLALLPAAFFGPISQSSAANAARHTPVQSIEFLGEVYSLVWRSDPMPNYSKTEYLPEGEELPYYNNMLLVEWLSDGTGVTEAVRAQVSFLKGLNESEADNAAGSKILNLMENPSTGEVLLVFVMSAPDAEREVIWEWNAYRYSSYTGANGQAGVRVFGHSVRYYGNDEGVYDFLEELDVDNPNSERINAVVTAQVP